MSWVKHLWKSTDYITPQVMNNFENGMEQAVNDADTMENFGVTFEDAGEEFTPNIQIKDADKLGGRLPSYFAKESELNLSGITNPNWQKNNVGEVANAIYSDLTKLGSFVSCTGQNNTVASNGIVNSITVPKGTWLLLSKSYKFGDGFGGIGFNGAVMHGFALAIFPNDNNVVNYVNDSSDSGLFYPDSRYYYLVAIRISV